MRIYEPLLVHFSIDLLSFYVCVCLCTVFCGVFLCAYGLVGYARRIATGGRNFHAERNSSGLGAWQRIVSGGSARPGMVSRLSSDGPSVWPAPIPVASRSVNQAGAVGVMHDHLGGPLPPMRDRFLHDVRLVGCNDSRLNLMSPRQEWQCSVVDPSDQT